MNHLDTPPAGAQTGLASHAARQASCLVVGVGNTLLQDDGFGGHVAAALSERPVDGLRVIDGGTIGLALLPEVEAAESLVLVDAAELGEAPGTVRARG